MPVRRLKTSEVLRAGQAIFDESPNRSNLFGRDIQAPLGDA